MQFDWNSKDSICFALYKSVIESNKATFIVWFESDNREENIMDLRSGEAEYRINNFRVVESIKDNSISFCPNIAGCPAYFKINTSESFQMSVVRKDGSVGDETTFLPGEIKIVLEPVDMRQYRVTVDAINTQASEEIIEETMGISGYDESVPEFFGGSFSSSTEELPGSQNRVQADKDSNAIDDTIIFNGGFNSNDDLENSFEDNTESNETENEQQHDNDESDAVSLFADMFPTVGSEQVISDLGDDTSSEKAEDIKTQNNRPAHAQDTVAEPLKTDYRQELRPTNEENSSGNVSGFSVPYVETDGIRERRAKVQSLQQDNDMTAKEVEKLEKQIAELEDCAKQLYEKKSALISKLESLQREYDKDYSKFQADIDEIKGRYTVDQSVLEFYKDKDLVAIEELLKQTDELVARVEEQIRIFVSAQQNKSNEIEKALKVGKKE